MPPEERLASVAPLSPSGPQPSVSASRESKPGATRPLSVAYVTMLFPAGSETFASLDVRELGRKGLRMEVHSLRPRHPDADRLAAERGLEGVPRTYNGVGASLRGVAAMLRAPLQSSAFIARLCRQTALRPRELLKSLALAPRAFGIFSALRRRPPDVLHVYWGHYPAMVGELVQRYLPQTVVSMSLGAYDLEADYPPTRGVAQQASFVRTHGDCNVPALVDRVGVAPERVAVIYNGIDLCLLPEEPLASERTPGRIVTAGRLIPDKAVDDVIRVLAEVRASEPAATLEVLGDGVERARLERLAADLGVGDAVTFRGHVSQRELFEALALAEIFLFMSRSASERLPNVIKEAMACGAICVTTESIGLDELILGPSHGRVVPQGDVAAASRAVLELLTQPELQRSIRPEAHRHVAQNFDVRRTSDAYVQRWTAAAVGAAAYRGPKPNPNTDPNTNPNPRPSPPA